MSLVTGFAWGANLDVTNYGAAGDGSKNDTAAIQKAIDAAASGDTVLLDSGKTFLSGPIYLKSDMTLRVDGTLLGSTVASDYLPKQPNRWEGLIVNQWQTLINAGTLNSNGVSNVSNIKIHGTGLINPRGRELKKNGVHINNAIQINNCDSFELKGVSTSKMLHIKEAARWTVHPIFCKNMQFQYLDIDSSRCPRNGDGIDLDSCSRVTIVDCNIYAQDDCIALKSGKGIEGYEINIPTSDVTIERCEFRCKRWSAIAVGTEASGGVHHITIENCTAPGVNKHFLYMKGNPKRGKRQRYHDITVRNCLNIKSGHALTHVDTNVGIVYSNAPGTPDFGGNIKFINVSSAANKGVTYNGSSDIRVHDITFDNCDFGTGSIQGKYCHNIAFTGCTFGSQNFTDFSNIVIRNKGQ